MQGPPTPRTLLPAAVAAQRRQLPRRDSGGSLGRQYLETATASQLAAGSELNYGAPSLRGDDAGGGGGSVAASPHPSRLTGTAPIPAGLVARYGAMFDSQPGQPGGGSVASSGTSSPVSRPVPRSQRTREWVQVYSSAVAAGQEISGVSGSPGSTAAQVAASTPTDSIEPASRAQQEEVEQQAPPPQPQQQQQRSSLFRLDLTAPPDPELVNALTPKRGSSAGVSPHLRSCLRCCLCHALGRCWSGW